MNRGHEESTCRFGHVWLPGDLSALELDAVTGIREAVNRLTDRARRGGHKVKLWTLAGGDTAVVARPHDDDERKRMGHVVEIAQMGRTVCPFDDFLDTPPVPHPDGTALLRLENDTANLLYRQPGFGHVGLVRNTGDKYRTVLVEPWAPVPGMSPAAAAAIGELLRHRRVQRLEDLLELGLAAQAATAA